MKKRRGSLEIRHDFFRPEPAVKEAPVFPRKEEFHHEADGKTSIDGGLIPLRLQKDPLNWSEQVVGQAEIFHGKSVILRGLTSLLQREVGTTHGHLRLAFSARSIYRIIGSPCPVC
jgi:hypothetical protein